MYRVRVHSDDLMPGTFSLCAKNIEKRTPLASMNGFRHLVVFHHLRDLKVFNYDVKIPFSRGLGSFEMVITPLTVDLEMGLSNVTSGLLSAIASLLATAQLALFTPTCSLLRLCFPSAICTMPPGRRGQSSLSQMFLSL